jgi:hypothetical protein
VSIKRYRFDDLEGARYGFDIPFEDCGGKMPVIKSAKTNEDRKELGRTWIWGYYEQS